MLFWLTWQPSIFLHRVISFFSHEDVMNFRHPVDDVFQWSSSACTVHEKKKKICLRAVAQICVFFCCYFSLQKNKMDNPRMMNKKRTNNNDIEMKNYPIWDVSDLLLSSYSYMLKYAAISSRISALQNACVWSMMLDGPFGCHQHRICMHGSLNTPSMHMCDPFCTASTHHTHNTDKRKRHKKRASNADACTSIEHGSDTNKQNWKNKTKTEQTDKHVWNIMGWKQTATKITAKF